MTAQVIKTIRSEIRHYGFVGFALVFLATTGWAQERVLESVRLAPEDEHDLLVLPDVSEASNSTYELDEFEIVVESKDDKVKYEAREKGNKDEPIVHWETVSEEPVHLIFDTKQKRFQRLTNKVRVVLDDYSDLDTLIEETDAKGGKAYPKLGYAVLELPAEKHPAAFIKTVEARTEVESAYVIVERPPEIPH